MLWCQFVANLRGDLVKHTLLLGAGDASHYHCKSSFKWFLHGTGMGLLFVTWPQDVFMLSMGRTLYSMYHSDP